jgi:F-type H+-transporting ATPase subunit b
MELDPLRQLNPAVMAAAAAVFVVAYVLLRRVFFLPVIEVMAARDERIEKARRALTEAEERQAEAQAGARTIVEGAEADAIQIAEKARASAEAQARQAVEGAQHKAQRALDKGRARIAREKEEELGRLRTETVECVTLACDKLVGEVPDGAIEATVDGLMARRFH